MKLKDLIQFKLLKSLLNYVFEDRTISKSIYEYYINSKDDYEFMELEKQKIFEVYNSEKDKIEQSDHDKIQKSFEIKELVIKTNEELNKLLDTDLIKEPKKMLLTYDCFDYCRIPNAKEFWLTEIEIHAILEIIN